MLTEHQRAPSHKKDKKGNKSQANLSVIGMDFQQFNIRRRKSLSLGLSTRMFSTRELLVVSSRLSPEESNGANSLLYRFVTGPFSAICSPFRQCQFGSRNLASNVFENFWDVRTCVGQPEWPFKSSKRLCRHCAWNNRVESEQSQKHDEELNGH